MSARSIGRPRSVPTIAAMDRRTLPCALALALGCAASPPEEASPGTSTTATSSDTGAATGTGTSETGDSGAEETGGTATGCCAAHEGPGCDELAVQACVCDAAPECCAFGWDEACAGRAVDACDATCMPDPEEGSSGDAPGDTGELDDTGAGTTGGPASTNEGPCCEAVDTGVGCGDPDVTACVCAGDPYCCDTNWDAYCVAEAAQGCAIDCANDCCVAHTATACNDVEVFGCAADMMDGCYVEWTQECVALAMASCGLTCA